MDIKVGQKIRLLRKKNNVTQDTLAARLGVTPQAVSRWESETCYPDIGYLPMIADFFGVSTDELLCYDSALKEEKVAEYLKKAEWFSDRDKLMEELALLRGAVAEIPSSYKLQLALAVTLSEISASGKPRAADLQEAVSLCLHILEDCTDDEIRDETKKTLCDIYSHEIGDTARALDIADRLHSISYCREIIKATLLTGDIAFRQAQQNLILFADNMWWHMYNLACVPDISGNHYTTEQKIQILLRGIDLIKVIFGDGDILFYHDRIANSYRQLAILFLSSGDNGKALDCFEKMAEHAISFDKRPADAVYDSVLINSITCTRDTDEDMLGVSKCERLLRGNFANRIWAPIRKDERFLSAVARMKECCEPTVE